jgi:hypothetical protein
MPVASRPAAPRGPSRGAPRSGGTPVWEAARLARGGWGGRVELWGGTRLLRHELEEGFLGGAHRQSVGACCGLQADRCAACAALAATRL